MCAQLLGCTVVDRACLPGILEAHQRRFTLPTLPCTHPLHTHLPLPSQNPEDGEGEELSCRLFEALTPKPLLCTALHLQIPEDGEDEEYTPEEMEALENDMQDDFEIAEMIK